MWRLKLLFLACLAAALSCAEGPIAESYRVVPPDLPGIWEEILGPPHWRLEWITEAGKVSSWEGAGEFPRVSPMDEWTSPVLAWPYWPGKGILPGQMRPAGALFPWDVSAGGISLSWEAGVDAVFWRELASSAGKTASGYSRFPWFFDWPAFRELMKDEKIHEEVRRDPWSADWKTVAEKTVESGFDRRRIKPEEKNAIPFPLPEGRWIGPSPFSSPVTALPGEHPVIPSGKNAQTWISVSGVFRCQGEAWVFIPW